MKRVLMIVTSLIVSIALSAQTILIFGGRDHDVFLGILNANPYNSKSIWNDYSTYGNMYNSSSIWNSYGTYGNEYSSYSPWNDYSSEVPVLVDSEGNYYGKFNSSNSNKVVRMICKLAPAIKDGKLELSDAYSMIFE